MKIEKKDSYTILTAEENVFSDVFTNFSKNIENHKTENVILHISDNVNIIAKDFLVFLNIASHKKVNGTSFVIIITSLNIDDLPEEINIVPTLQEAEDILEMENIERELGF